MSKSNDQPPRLTEDDLSRLGNLLEQFHAYYRLDEDQFLILIAAILLAGKSEEMPVGKQKRSLVLHGALESAEELIVLSDVERKTSFERLVGDE